MTRETSVGLLGIGVNFYDGQGFMVPKKSKITSATKLKGATVCVQSGTTTEKNLADFSRTRKLGIKPIVFDTYEAGFKAPLLDRAPEQLLDAAQPVQDGVLVRPQALRGDARVVLGLRRHEPARAIVNAIMPAIRSWGKRKCRRSE